MKKSNLLFLLIIFSLIEITNCISAQSSYCFWVANWSDEALSTIRIRQSGTSYFGDDLIPEMMIESYNHVWIRTGASYTSVYDIEISKADGTPLTFTWTGRDGNEYTRSYITLDLSPLNTLMISSKEYGSGFTYNDAYEDEYGFGDPCNP